jgi:hypothetical protein
MPLHKRESGLQNREKDDRVTVNIGKIWPDWLSYPGHRSDTYPEQRRMILSFAGRCGAWPMERLCDGSAFRKFFLGGEQVHERGRDAAAATAAER